MRTFVILAVASASMGAQQTDSAQKSSPADRLRFWKYYPHSWSLTDENDTFDFFRGSDSSYTQGLRLTWQVDGWPFGKRVTQGFRVISLSFLVPEKRDQDVYDCGSRAEISVRPCGTMAVAVGQTQYTPNNLRTAIRDSMTRPYAGFLFGGLTLSALYPHVLVNTELQAGRVGPHSYSEDTQSLAHWINAWENTRPQGWRHQIRDRWQASIRNSYVIDPGLHYCRRGCTGSANEGRMFDVLPDFELLYGNPITRASVGGTVRAGYGFPDLQLRDRIPTSRGVATRSASLWKTIFANTWGNVFVNWQHRYVSHNNFITGTSADEVDNGWGVVRQVETEAYVHERAWGAAVGLHRLVISYQLVTRTPEYNVKAGPAARDFEHRYGSIVLSLTTPAVSR